MPCDHYLKRYCDLQAHWNYDLDLKDHDYIFFPVVDYVGLHVKTKE